MRQLSAIMRRAVGKNAHLFHFSIATALCFLSLAPSFAAADEAEARLTLKQALALSVEFHPLIAARKSEYQAAIGELAAARWSTFPDASFSFRGFREDGGQEAADQEVLTVSQPIWTGGKLSGTISVAKAKREAARLAIIEAEQRLMVDTVRAFVEMHRSQAKLNISKSNVKEHERLSQIIERRVKAATSPEVDLRLANARLAFSQSQLLQNANALDAARAELEQLIGRPVARIAPAQSARLEQFSLPEAEREAISFSPAMRKLRAEIEALKAQEKVSKSALYPQLSLGYEKTYGEVSNNRQDEQVFLGLDFQPGAGLSSRASIIASQARKDALEASLAALERDIRREVKITWRSFSAAEMQLSPTRLLVESTSEVVASYLRQYTVGRKSWLDVLNAQRELVQARQALVDHEAVLQVASHKMQLLLGALTREKLVTRSE